MEERHAILSHIHLFTSLVLLCSFCVYFSEKLRKRRSDFRPWRPETAKKGCFSRVFFRFLKCNALTYRRNKIFSNIFAGVVVGVYKKCIFAVPFCAPGERCEREGMRHGAGEAKAKTGNVL